MAIGPDTITSAVASAKAAVSDLLTSVTHRAFASQAGDGAPTFSADVLRVAFVEVSAKAIRRQDGSVANASFSLTILDPVEVTLRDRFVVDGLARDVIAFECALHPSTGVPYSVQVWVA